MKDLIAKQKTKECIKRYENNPILSSKDIAYDSDLVFNAGVAKYRDKYIMIFRNDFGYQGGSRFGGTNLGIAYSEDGIKWEASKEIFLDSKLLDDSDVTRIYDPRLIVIEDKLYMCFAADTHHGVRGGIAVTEDLKNFQLLTLSTPDNRNMVLFPEKINNRFVRLERPFPVYGRGGIDQFDIWISYSYDGIYWGDASLLLGVEYVLFANDKIVPAAPPVKTDKGWLVLFHAVDIDYDRGKNGWEDKWQKRYTVGIMLLDLENPSEVIGMSKEPILIPETDYEKNGFRNDVIFPGGLILEDSKHVKIYYGAADTCECLAFAEIEDLINLCKEKKTT